MNLNLNEYSSLFEVYIAFNFALVLADKFYQTLLSQILPKSEELDSTLGRIENHLNDIDHYYAKYLRNWDPNSPALQDSDEPMLKVKSRQNKGEKVDVLLAYQFYKSLHLLIAQILNGSIVGKRFKFLCFSNGILCIACLALAPNINIASSNAMHLTLIILSILSCLITLSSLVSEITSWIFLHLVKSNLEVTPPRVGDLTIEDEFQANPKKPTNSLEERIYNLLYYHEEVMAPHVMSKIHPRRTPFYILRNRLLLNKYKLFPLFIVLGILSIPYYFISKLNYLKVVVFYLVVVSIIITLISFMEILSPCWLSTVNHNVQLALILMAPCLHFILYFFVALLNHIWINTRLLKVSQQASRGLWEWLEKIKRDSSNPAI